MAPINRDNSGVTALELERKAHEARVEKILEEHPELAVAELTRALSGTLPITASKPVKKRAPLPPGTPPSHAAGRVDAPTGPPPGPPRPIAATLARTVNPALANAADLTTPEARCAQLRASGPEVYSDAGLEVHNFGNSWKVQAIKYFRPAQLSHIVHAIEEVDHYRASVRALGSAYSYSDVALPTSTTTNSFPTVSARGFVSNVIDMTAVNRSLQHTIPGILRPDATGDYFHVEAGITIRDLNTLLHHHSPRLALATMGGAVGQTLAGAISTGTHGGDFDRPAMTDYVRAIHLVSYGGVEHWIEPSHGITDREAIRRFFPCIRPANIHYDDELFSCVLVSLGRFGVIYSCILEVVSEHGLRERRVRSDWSTVVREDPTLRDFLDGSLVTRLSGWEEQLPNRFAQILISPYADPSGRNACWISNRAEIAIPAAPRYPDPDPLTGSELSATVQAAIPPDDASHHANWIGIDLRHFSGSLPPDFTLAQRAVALLNHAMQCGYLWLLQPVMDLVLGKMQTPGIREDVGHRIMEVGRAGGLGEFDTLSIEVACSVDQAVTMVNRILTLASSMARGTPPTYVGGYISLRVCGHSRALLSMQRFAPTCMIEVAILKDTERSVDFIEALQRIVLGAGGILHWGLCNNQLRPENLAALIPHDYGARVWRVKQQLIASARETTGREPHSEIFETGFTHRLGV